MWKRRESISGLLNRSTTHTFIHLGTHTHTVHISILCVCVCTVRSAMCTVYCVCLCVWCAGVWDAYVCATSVGCVWVCVYGAHVGGTHVCACVRVRPEERKSVGEGVSVDLGGGGIVEEGSYREGGWT